MSLRSLSIGFTLVACLAHSAHAMSKDSCPKLVDWMNGEVSDVAALVSADAAPVCGTSLALSGAGSRHCAWPFAYRAPEARSAFEALTSLLAFCFEGAAIPGADQIVNHPDSYDLREFKLVEGTISASLKDKGALQQTYIFLRAERRAP